MSRDLELSSAEFERLIAGASNNPVFYKGVFAEKFDVIVDAEVMFKKAGAAFKGKFLCALPRNLLSKSDESVKSILRQSIDGSEANAKFTISDFFAKDSLIIREELLLKDPRYTVLDVTELTGDLEVFVDLDS